eukprot:UN11822
MIICIFENIYEQVVTQQWKNFMYYKEPNKHYNPVYDSAIWTYQLADRQIKEKFSKSQLLMLFIRKCQDFNNRMYNLETFVVTYLDKGYGDITNYPDKNPNIQAVAKDIDMEKIGEFEVDPSITNVKIKCSQGHPADFGKN